MTSKRANVTALRRRTAQHAAAVATGRRVLSTAAGRAAWRKILGTGVLPDAQKARWATRVADRLRDLGRTQDAAGVLAGTAEHVARPASRSQLLTASVLLELQGGATPTGLQAAVTALVAEADAALAAGRRAEAVAPLTSAAEIAFHRTLHFDGLSSPLADNPETFLAPLHASTAWRRVSTTRGRRTQAIPGPVTGRPHRLLMVTYKNWLFLDPLAKYYARRPDVELRRLDLADIPQGVLPLSPLQQIRLRLTGPDDARSQGWSAHVSEHLDWADTVFVDWLQRSAVLITALDPGSARVVVRLHSFEAFTAFPHLVDYSRVDDLIVVGAHLGRLVHRAVPASRLPRLTVLANAAQLRPYARFKDPHARFTLAVVGYGVVAKDAIWAVELLAVLRRHDPRYRLLLVGRDLAAEGGPAAQTAYRERLERRLAEPDVRGAVERVPFTPDVSTVLAGVGTIVSSSVRESFHLALVEGAASGAVPVVRDWPLFAAVSGPHSLFPGSWIVDDVQAGAERVLATTKDERTWIAEGQAAREWVLSRYDWEVTRPQYDSLLLGE